MKKWFAFLALGGALITLEACSYAQVSNFKFNASESPEVRGPGTYLEEQDNMGRMSVSLLGGQKDEIPFPVRPVLAGDVTSIVVGEAVDSATLSPSASKAAVNNSVIELGDYSVIASMDFFMKWKQAYFQLGLGVYDGLYYYAGMGTNRKYFEAGVFLGQFHQFTTVYYYGYWCDDLRCNNDDNNGTFSADEPHLLSDVFVGVYAGLHAWRLSLDYSISTYTPSVNVNSLDYDMPAVISNYLSLGIRLTDSWIVRGGVVATFADKINDPHLGFKASLEWNIGQEKPSSHKTGVQEQGLSSQSPAWKSPETQDAPGGESPAGDAPAETQEEPEAEPAAVQEVPATSGEPEPPVNDAPAPAAVDSLPAEESAAGEPAAGEPAGESVVEEPAAGELPAGSDEDESSSAAGIQESTAADEAAEEN